MSIFIAARKVKGRKIEKAPMAPVDLEKTPEWFHVGQRKTFESTANIIGVCAGWQSGKTVTGPWWLLREISRSKASDFAIVNATFPLLDKKQLPEFLKVLAELRIGSHKRNRNVIEITEREAMVLGRDCAINIWLGSADRPDSLESATYGAMWFDEPGQAPEAAFHVCCSRVAIHRGRLLLTSKPYAFNWYKRLIWDQRNSPDIEVVNYRSIDNPMFPVEQYEAAKTRMPAWRHKMMYDGLFSRPAGAVYDCFDAATDTATLPESKTPRRAYLGVDFGSANMAGVCVVEHPAEKGLSTYYVTGTYHKGGRTDADHASSLLAMTRGHVFQMACGGAYSENEWRSRFWECGLQIARPPFREVETGIGCVYRLLAEGRLKFDPSLSKILKEIEDYQYETDDDGIASEKIEDKSKFHRMDALRYICSAIAHSEGWSESEFYAGREAA